MNHVDFTQDPTLLDQYFGFHIDEIEAHLLVAAKDINPYGNHHTWGQALHQGNQTWVGLHPQSILTPYQELLEICQLLNPVAGQTIVDLGAGYGRMGLVMKLHFPEVHFLGLEFVGERVKEGQRILKEQHCELARLEQADLTVDEFQLPDADYYFIYDYGTIPHLRRTMQQIEDKVVAKKNFKVIARGKGIRSLIGHEHPWLASVFEAVHRTNYSIYSMCSPDTFAASSVAPE
jgi:hypothetical protein